MAGIELIELKKSGFIDERGWTVNPIPFDLLSKNTFGHIHITSAVPGAIRGNHFHSKLNEFLFVFGGEYDFYYELGNEIICRRFDENELFGIQINCGVSHALKNTCGKMIYIASYYDDHYDLANPDTTRKLLI
ncbi:MAG: hypothetical protein CO189_07140 [candidate division Zixibacteria bacterium CG_4_9_14_3_um_filter_46_8]|nr:MAG: hypothetical protein CO189_07140 [candidate division Zixibacteria bacterium CG_4_9_14_3_um_filter_46_8]